MNTSARTFRDRYGHVFQARMAPHEDPRGPVSQTKAIVFKAEDGRWITSIPVPSSVILDMLPDRGLEELMVEALGGIV